VLLSLFAAPCDCVLTLQVAHFAGFLLELLLAFVLVLSPLWLCVTLQVAHFAGLLLAVLLAYVLFGDIVG